MNLESTKVFRVQNITKGPLPLHIDKIRNNTRCDMGLTPSGETMPPCVDCMEPTHNNNTYVWEKPGDVKILFENVSLHLTRKKEWRGKLAVVGEPISLSAALLDPRGIYQEVIGKDGKTVPLTNIEPQLMDLGRGGTSEGVGESIGQVRASQRFIGVEADFGEDGGGMNPPSAMMGNASLPDQE